MISTLKNSLLAVSATQITLCGASPFVSNSALVQELKHFGRIASGFKTARLGSRYHQLKHFQSLHRQVFMYLDPPMQSLDISFRVKHGGYYLVYASSGLMKCFECGDVGHKWITWLLGL